MTLAEAQGGTSREASGSSVAWDVENLASEAGLEVVEVLPFNVNDFEGYQPKRAYSDSTFPYKNARVHILCRCRVTIPGEAPSERSLPSRVASYLIDKVAWGRLPSHIHVSVDEVIEALTPYVNTSAVALKLRGCAETYKHFCSYCRALVRGTT